MNSKEKTCGKCTVCCKLMGIVELNKLPRVDCKHLKNKKDGCKIYPNRPPTCKSFKCLWLATPSMPSILKPSTCGFMMYQMEIIGIEVIIIKMIKTSSQWDDHFNHPEYGSFLQILWKKFPMILHENKWGSRMNDLALPLKDALEKVGEQNLKEMRQAAL